ncbi:hypothetical protein SAMN05421880_1334 [Nitrosomonas nitrosa]|uniref:Uncharacterized protein n=1 Tax=Nitrosomonas nitrosa TaxID=52442 RepID=A0A1I4TM01_9PROT|nr:hypothetical protein [Nitrosomonas nitrosa]SFM77653.1 hypothetical protein SAMN05421880_1334 [Nitrosomonas nitrosa]
MKECVEVRRSLRHIYQVTSTISLYYNELSIDSVPFLSYISDHRINSPQISNLCLQIAEESKLVFLQVSMCLKQTELIPRISRTWWHSSPALLDLKQSVTLGSAELILSVAPKLNGMVMSAGGENWQKFYLANTEEEEISKSRTHPMTYSV